MTKKIFFTKNFFWSNFFFCPKIFYDQKFVFDQKIFLTQKKFFFEQKFFLTKNFFWWKIFFDEKILDQKFFLTKIWPKISFDQKIFDGPRPALLTVTGPIFYLCFSAQVTLTLSNFGLFGSEISYAQATNSCLLWDRNMLKQLETRICSSN